MSWTCDHCGHDRVDCECNGTTYALAELNEKLARIIELLEKIYAAQP